MADEQSGSLREFADIIQEKAGPLPEHGTDQPEPGAVPPDMRLPRLIIAGVTAGAGIVIGYLLGRRGR